MLRSQPPSHLPQTETHTPTEPPGLYNPSSTAPHFYGLKGTDERSPYPSPYLHPVQPQPPRTVTNARKEVDVYSGRKIINQYEIIDELGRGVHGKVKLARDLQEGLEVAIKIVQRYSKKKRLGKSSNPEDKVKKEVAILKKVQHPNVVRMIEVIDDPQEAKVYIVLEFCELKEISWRTAGSSEIVLLENRRLARESQGLPEEDVQTQEDKAIRVAMRRLEKARMRPRTHRARSASHLWSLEYGGESDEEDADTVGSLDPLSATGSNEIPSATDAATADLSRAPSHSTMQYLLLEELSRSPTAIRDSRRPSTSHDTLSAHEAGFGSFSSLQKTTSNSQWQRWSLPMSPETTEEGRGRRKTSMAESITSQMTQFVQDEIGEEFRYVPTMTIPECRAVFRDALIGLDYLHYHGIIHRDIKPANLLRTRDYHVKISDFGVSYLGKPIREGEESAETSESESKDIEEEAELAKNVGTPAFYAPELCSLDLAADTPAVTGQIDVWALGVTLYCLLFARTPFHADNEFALMRRIANEEVFIPRRRLKAVDLRSAMRSSSVGPVYPLHTDKRLPGEYQHEYIDDELHDLLKRLFVKNPKKRITIRDIKTHPWVLHDVTNPTAWPDETDPSRREEGRKIQISSKEVEEAVKPISFINRMRSIGSRAGKAFGFSSSRRRGNSSANSSENGSTSASVTSLPDRESSSGRACKSKPRLDESISAALRASRERDTSEHPLSRSVTASPDRGSPSNSPDEFRASSVAHSPVDDYNSYRPRMPERNQSELSTSGSIRTIRPIDADRGRQPSLVSVETDLPGAPRLLTELSSANATTGLWSGAGHSLGQGLRGNPPLSPGMLAASRHNSLEGREGLIGGPSIAISNTSAVGQVDLPSVLRAASSTGSPYHSPQSSRKSSLVDPAGVSSPASPQPRRSSQQLSEIASAAPSRLSPLDMNQPVYRRESWDTSEEQYQHAIDTLSRRRLLEIEHSRERDSASRNASRPPTAAGQDPACPPSPDDDENPTSSSEHRPQQLHQNYFSAHDDSHGAMFPSAQTFSSASSEDQLTSAGLSRATSHPSMPSIVSADTSLPDMEYLPKTDMDTTSSSEGTIHTGSYYPSQNALHSASDADVDDNALDSDEECDDSDADEDFIVMSRKKSQREGLTRSGSVSNAQLSRRRETVLRSKKSSPSGSSKTAKKVRSLSPGRKGTAPH